jgi:hypothetical protein
MTSKQHVARAYWDQRWTISEDNHLIVKARTGPAFGGTSPTDLGFIKKVTHTSKGYPGGGPPWTGHLTFAIGKMLYACKQEMGDVVPQFFHPHPPCKGMLKYQQMCLKRDTKMGKLAGTHASFL